MSFKCDGYNEMTQPRHVSESDHRPDTRGQADGLLYNQSFRLFRFFILFSIVAIVLILLLVGFGLRSVLHNYVIWGAEEDSIHLSNALRDIEMEAILHTDASGREHLGVHSPEIESLDRQMRVFLPKFNIIKIKIFNDRRRIVYSTDRSIIGEIDADNAKLEKALGGSVVSKLEIKDRVWDLTDEQHPNVSVVETYVPVRGTNGQIVGSFEVYKDVTGDFKSSNVTLVRSVSVVATALLVVFAALSAMMYLVSRTAYTYDLSRRVHEARTQAIVDAAAEGILTFNDSGVIKSCNAAAERIFGYTAVEILGKNFRDLLATAQEFDRKEYLDRLCHTIQADGDTFELTGLRKDDRSFPMWMSLSGVQFAGEHICTAIIRDMTQQKRVELQQRERDLLRAEEMTKTAQLATGVVHELRNPLTSIKLFVQNNREETVERGMSAEDVLVIEGEIGRMERTLQTFLNYARPAKTVRRNFNLIDLIDEIFILIEGRAFQQRVACVKIAPPDRKINIDADRDQIQQLLLNLVLNALEMMHDGGTLEINISPPTEGQVELRVVDSGPGIPESLLPQLFEPFVTTKETGVGLGLMLSRRIAEDHGGTLTVYNHPKGGACFVLRLPVSA